MDPIPNEENNSRGSQRAKVVRLTPREATVLNQEVLYLLEMYNAWDIPDTLPHHKGR